MFTGFAQVLVGAALFLCARHALHDVLMALYELFGELFARARVDSSDCFTCCAWSAELTSTTLSLPPRAARGGCVHVPSQHWSARRR